MKDAVELIRNYADRCALRNQEYLAANAENICVAACQLAIRIANGGKLFLGAESQIDICARYIAARFTGMGDKKCAALPAISLVSEFSSDSFMLLARQIGVLGASSDVFLMLSISKATADAIEAVNMAKEMGIYTIYVTPSYDADILADCQMGAPVENLLDAIDLYKCLGNVLHGVCEYYLYENVGAIAPFIHSPKRGKEYADI